MYGLGKKRTRFGVFIDKHNVKQGDISRITMLSRNTVKEVCNNEEHVPNNSTIVLLLGALKELTGEDVKREDFWQ